MLIRTPATGLLAGRDHGREGWSQIREWVRQPALKKASRSPMSQRRRQVLRPPARSGGISCASTPSTFSVSSVLSIAAFCVSLIALFVSAITLSITYRKEAHRIRLELSPAKYGGVVLGINNDSGIVASVRSIGHFRRFGKVTWFGGQVGNYRSNKFVDFPFAVEARSTFEVHINTIRDLRNFNATVGFCVQLDTGRVYVLPQEVPRKDALRMHLSSWVSRLSRGRIAPGIDRPRINII